MRHRDQDDDGQRHGEKSPHRTPQPGPEGDGQQDRERVEREPAAVNETIEEPTKPASHQAGKQRARPLANKDSRLDRNGLILARRLLVVVGDSPRPKITQSQPSNSVNLNSLDEVKNFLDETNRGHSPTLWRTSAIAASRAAA